MNILRSIGAVLIAIAITTLLLLLLAGGLQLFGATP